jgi:acyl-CoA synthetase (AMP-forming)/AMP-acid ligase II
VVAVTLTDVVTTDAARAAYDTAGLWDGSTLRERLDHWTRAGSQVMAVIDDSGRRRTYAQLDADATALAGRLQSTGIAVGDVVSVQLPNRYEAVVAATAVAKLGAVINTLLPGYRQRELAHVFRTAAPAAIITPVSHRGFDFGPLVDDVLRSTGHSLVHVTDDGLDGAPPSRFEPGPPVEARAVSELIFTSGTEAEPKAVMHTEQTTNFSVRTAYADLGMGPGDVVWMPSPVGHSTGFNYGLRMALYHGLTLVLQDQWDPGRAAELILAEGCSYTLAATTFLKDLVDLGVALPTMRLFGCGGAPVPPPLVDRASQLGIGVLRLYGSTEVLVATWNRADDPAAARRNTDGRPMSRVAIEVRDDSGRACRPGEVGEIFTRGPNTCVGFFRDEERTGRTFADGWVQSGDLAVIDGDGFLTVASRKKEIIIRGGLNITPREVEDLLVDFPEVDRAAVVGLPDERLGERACACVVLAPGSSLDLTTVVTRLRDLGLATYKLPERLEVLSALPMTASGKVQKHEIVKALVP